MLDAMLLEQRDDRGGAIELVHSVSSAAVPWKGQRQLPHVDAREALADGRQDLVLAVQDMVRHAGGGAIGIARLHRAQDLPMFLLGRRALAGHGDPANEVDAAVDVLQRAQNLAVPGEPGYGLVEPLVVVEDALDVYIVGLIRRRGQKALELAQILVRGTLAGEADGEHLQAAPELVEIVDLARVELSAEEALVGSCDRGIPRRRAAEGSPAAASGSPKAGAPARPR